MRAGVYAVRAAVSVATIVTLTACAPRLHIDNVPVTSHFAGLPKLGDFGETLVDSSTVQVRYFSFSPTVSVLSWYDAEPGYGLRGFFRRDGSVIRDHRLYVMTYFDTGIRAYPRAIAVNERRVLKPVGISRDVRSCWDTSTVCTPYETFGVRIPDKLLRSVKDSLAVKFYAPVGRELYITLHRDLIDAYLATIDSVRVAMRSR